MLEAIKEAAREAGKIMLDSHLTEGQIEEKEGHANFVTAYDVAVQKFLAGRLPEILPEAGFLGYTFIVDPIDGTTNFIVGYQMSAVSIGLAKDGEAVLGVVYNPFREEMYWAEKGKGAFLNGKPLKICDGGLKDGVVCFGTAPYNPEYWDRTFKVMREILPRTLDLRRQGSAALDISYVAAGRNVLFFECKLCPWDYAAAKCILEEAGGVLCTMEGEKTDFNRVSSVLAGTPTAAKEFLALGL